MYEKLNGKPSGTLQHKPGFEITVFSVRVIAVAWVANGAPNPLPPYLNIKHGLDFVPDLHTTSTRRPSSPARPAGIRRGRATMTSAARSRRRS